MYPNIALMGRARSGKDTIAKHLIHQAQYVRVAFADPLKGMALRIDPVVMSTLDSAENPYDVRLSEAVEDGWERAKDEYPEVRRFLQHLGQSIREEDEGFWLRTALSKVDTAKKWNLPVIVTDVRYPNEYDALKARGFTMARVSRPGDDHPFRAAARHPSETALDDYRADVKILNSGPLAQLYHAADILAGL